ncbi:hypothetical protein CR513_20590, partial [Mucuna pruriens]
MATFESQFVANRAKRLEEECCEFHQTWGQTAEDCKVLKSQIEQLIQDDYLGRFVKKKGNKKHTLGELPRRDRSQTPRRDRDREKNRSGGHRKSQLRSKGQTPLSGNNSNNNWRRFDGGNVDIGPKKSVLAIQERPTIRWDSPITFTDEDYEGTVSYSDNPMVISVIIADYRVKWVLVDQGSSTNILFWPVFKKLGLLESSLEDCLGTLIGFTGEQVQIRGVINLEMILGTRSTRKVVKMTFIVVNSPTSYNVILGRSALNRLQYPVGNLVGAIRVDQRVARKCYDESTRISGGQLGRHTTLDEQPQVHFLELDPRFDRGDARPQPNEDASAWTPTEMLGINPDFLLELAMQGPSLVVEIAWSTKTCEKQSVNDCPGQPRPVRDNQLVTVYGTKTHKRQSIETARGTKTLVRGSWSRLPEALRPIRDSRSMIFQDTKTHKRQLLETAWGTKTRERQSIETAWGNQDP